jgi:hypothetical protein
MFFNIYNSYLGMSRNYINYDKNTTAETSTEPSHLNNLLTILKTYLESVRGFIVNNFYV